MGLFSRLLRLSTAKAQRQFIAQAKNPEAAQAEIAYFGELLEGLMTIASLDEPNFKSSSEWIHVGELLSLEIKARQAQSKIDWQLHRMLVLFECETEQTQDLQYRLAQDLLQGSKLASSPPQNRLPSLLPSYSYIAPLHPP